MTDSSFDAWHLPGMDPAAFDAAAESTGAKPAKTAETGSVSRFVKAVRGFDRGTGSGARLAAT